MDFAVFAAAVFGGIIIFLVFYKKYLNKAVICTSEARIDGKTVIITGSNTGIGKEAARELARRGGRIILACRDMDKAQMVVEELVECTGNKHIVAKKLDLASLASIRQFAADVKSSEAHLDILINNAGLGNIPYSKTVDGFEMTFGVNYLGPLLLTNLLLDLLKCSSPSRIVNVSAHGHIISTLQLDDLMMEKSYGPMRAYCHSKLAQIMYTRELGRRLRGTGVTTYALHPGVVHTEFARHFSIMRSPLLRWIGEAVQRFFFKTAVEGSQTTVFCAVAKELEEESGLYYSNCALSSPTTEAMNKKKIKALWKKSHDLLGLDAGASEEEDGPNADEDLFAHQAEDRQSLRNQLLDIELLD